MTDTRIDDYTRATYAAAYQHLTAFTSLAQIRGDAADKISAALDARRQRGEPLSAVLLQTPVRNQVLDNILHAAPYLVVASNLTRQHLDTALIRAAQAAAIIVSREAR